MFESAPSACQSLACALTATNVTANEMCLRMCACDTAQRDAGAEAVAGTKAQTPHQSSSDTHLLQSREREWSEQQLLQDTDVPHEALEQTTGLQLETHAAARNGSNAQSNGTEQVSSSSDQQLSRTRHPEGKTTTNKCTVNKAERANETAPHVNRLVVPSTVSSVPSRAHRTTDSHGTTAATTTGASSSAAIAGARESSCWFFWSCCGSSCSIKPDEQQRLLVSQAATDRHSRIPLTLEPPHTSGSDNDQTKRTADTGQ